MCIGVLIIGKNENKHFLNGNEGDVVYLKRINITNFRNYESLELDLFPGINIIYGKNAQGKTNLLESIYVLGLTKSHRSFIDHSLIKNDANFAYISGILRTDHLDNKLEIGFDSKKKKLKVNQEEVKKISDYISKMNIIIFFPDDLELVKGSPIVRRRYLNMELCQLYGNYVNLLNDYNKLLKIRNEYLKKQGKKEEIDENYFQILTNYLVDKAVSIYRMRKKFIDELNEISPGIYKDITGFDGFHLVYKMGVDFKEYKLDSMKKEMLEKLKQNRSIEMKLGSTLIGPHRDDFEFYLGDLNIKNYGSQGQQRVSVLALKLSEIQVFMKYRDTSPILLLDDVFSELDEIKKNNLLEYINSGIQTIITTTDLETIDKNILSSAKKIEIEEAKIIHIEEVDEDGRENRTL